MEPHSVLMYNQEMWFKRMKNVGSYLLSFAPYVGPPPTLGQILLGKITVAMSVILPPFFIIGSIILTLFLLYELAQWVKEKKNSDSIKASYHLRIFIKGVILFVGFLILMLVAKFFYLNCIYLLDYGVTLIDICLR